MCIHIYIYITSLPRTIIIRIGAVFKRRRLMTEILIFSIMCFAKFRQALVFLQGQHETIWIKNYFINI